MLLLVPESLFSQPEVIFFNGDHDFFLNVSIVDTVPCKCENTSIYNPYGKTRKMHLLRISIDSVLQIFNEGIYESLDDLKNTSYMWVPIDFILKTSNNYVFTFLQYQKDYFYFSQKTETPNIEIVKESVWEESGYCCPKGLITIARPNIFWRCWYRLKTPCEKHLEKRMMKPMNKSKDPVLKCIKKYEKGNG
jgi:hypothetical protein